VEVLGTAGLCISVAVLPMQEDGRTLSLLPSCWLGSGSDLLPSPKLGPQPEPKESAVQFTCARGEQVCISAGARRGTLSCCHGESAVSSSVCALSLAQREVTEEALGAELRLGDLAPFLSFGASASSSAAGAWLPDEPQRSRILAKLHGLASRNGVVHNIPRQAPLEESPERTRRAGDASSECAMDVDSSSELQGPRLMQRPGIVTGYNVSEDWAGLSDCMICLGGLGEETWVRGPPLRTHCGHYFHAKCLQKCNRSAIIPGSAEANQNTQGCPNCRAKDPLQDVQPAGGHGIQRWRLDRDVCDRALEPGKGYRIVAALCQDPKAVVDSAMMFSCNALMLNPHESTISDTM